MSRDASIELDWADGTYTFRLAWAQLISLQEATDCGPLMLMRRLLDGSWRVGDIASTIRWGLIGGGKTPDEAGKLIRAYVEARPPSENVLVAYAIIAAGTQGAPDEKVGEFKGEGAKNSTTSPTEKSASQESTD